MVICLRMYSESVTEVGIEPSLHCMAFIFLKVHFLADVLGVVKVGAEGPQCTQKWLVQRHLLKKPLCGQFGMCEAYD